MHLPTYQTELTRSYSIAVPAEPDELFPSILKRAYTRLESFRATGQRAPSPENIEWAKKVLLRVLPRHYLLAAEIDHFDREIHVNWEYENRRVTVFLPAPGQVKIYCEKVTDQEVEHNLRPQANNPWEIKGVLTWLYAPNA
jgi:hypothetical protein